jgi:cellulose synthase/poly-beta-1,6-N-acetylglucosamine synthase-like glycosyltransferase
LVNPNVAPKAEASRDPTVEAFRLRPDDLCAAVTLTRGEWLREQLGLTLVFVAILYDWKIATAFLLFALASFYVLTAAYKFLLVALSLVVGRRAAAAPAPAEPEGGWPVYTVLLPLYREPAVAAKIVAAMKRLDYPPEKLDIKLLLEEDDQDTIARCRAADLPPYFEMIVVPPSLPKTKPRACNHGLPRARGEFLVIFDAEDRPEPDQLKKAVAAFRAAPGNVVCFQGRLNYYNPDQTLLTKWFTLEYTAWFDLFLPGLTALGAPIPLGGTSNHFRTAALRDLGGWDPFNLTEDCDLGIRLHGAGRRTRMLDSTTWEEATAHLGNWTRQRSRWIKGYIQTHFVHLRSHAKALRRLGVGGYISFWLTVGGLSLTLLLNPLFWLAGLTYLGLWGAGELGVGDGAWALRYHDRVDNLPWAPLTAWSRWSWYFWYASVGLLAANVLFVGVNLLACARRGLWRLWWVALASPAYWLLISIAAWKGFGQLFSRPFYWERTVHGLSGEEGNFAAE